MNPPYRNYTIRLDQSISDKDKCLVATAGTTVRVPTITTRNQLYVGDRFLFISKQGMIDEVHTFNANTVLNVRYGFNRFIRGSDAPEEPIWNRPYYPRLPRFL
jgi:hypothetical protein